MACDDLAAEVERLRAELAEAKQDSVRLEWWMHAYHRYGVRVRNDRCTIWRKEDLLVIGNGTMREAIDGARLGGAELAEAPECHDAETAY
jgi:hypothetical protein